MSRALMIVCGAWIAVTALGWSQERSSVSGLDAIVTRQAGLDMSSITFRSMVDAIKGGGEAKSQGYPAAALAKWAKALPQMFPPGSGKGETSVITQARSLIWADRAGFDRAAAAYVDATARLSALAAANDTPGFSQQLEKVNQACASCHARYKEGAQGPPQK